MRKLLAISAFLYVLLSSASCANKDQGPISGVSPDQARALNGERSAFESSQDPPINAGTHFAAGVVAESHNDWAAAAKQYKEAATKTGPASPEHKAVLYRLGVCLSHAKKYSDAVDVWKQYVEATGGEAAAYSNLAFCHELAGETDHAEQAYRRGVERDPKNLACRTNYGLMLARLGRTQEAAEQMRAVLSDAEVHYNLASVLENQGKRDAAKAEYRKALDLDPGLNEAVERLAALK